MKLPRHLPKKKILSLSKKYMTIPDEFLGYYPKIESEDLSAAIEKEEKSDDELTFRDIIKQAERKRRHKGAEPSDRKQHKIIAQGLNPVGRPRKAKALLQAF